MKKRIFIFLSVITVFYIKLYSQELTWQDCVDAALNNNLEILSAKAKLEQAKANSWIVKSSIFPQISASASASKTGNEPFIENNSLSLLSNTYSESYSYGLSGKQILFDGFKSLNDINKSNEDLNIAEVNYKITSASIRYKLKQSFVNLMKAQELINITQDILERRKKQFTDIKLRYEAGKEHRGSLLNAQAGLAQAEFECEQAKRNLMLAKEALAGETGMNEYGDLKVKEDFNLITDLNEKQDFDKILLNNLNYRLLYHQKKSAEHSYSSAIGSFFPSVYFNASVSKKGDEFLPQDTNWFFGVNLSLPIFEGGLLIAKAKAAKDYLTQIEKDYEYGEKSILLDIKQTWNNFFDANENYKIQEQFLQAAVERAKIADIQYSNGLLNFDNWIIIQDNLVNAKKAWLNSQANLLIAEAAWIQIKGGTLEDEKK